MKCGVLHKNQLKRFIMKILLLIVVQVLLIEISLQAQNNTKVNLSFENKVQSWLTENNVPAVGIGIIEDAKIKYIKVFGELKKGVPAPDNAIFSIASITKTVTAMLTLKLVEAGQWDLDAPLFQHWVDPDIANNPLHKKLTTRHVLSHKTGFPNWRGKGKLTFNFEPGTEYNYSGEGFVYLARALESKFGKTLQQLSDSLLFKPMGMKDTRYCWNKNVDESRFVYGHDTKGNIYPRSERAKSSAGGAAGGLLTTVEDYCKFSINLINGAGLSEILYNDMVSPHSKIKEHHSYGLGWEIISDLPNGEYTLGHGGNNKGYKTKGIILPESKRAVIVFTNGDNGIFVYNNVIKESIDIGENILDYLRGLNNRQLVALPQEVLEKYIGKYLIDSHGKIVTITKSDSVLVISSDGSPTAKLYPEAEGKFFLKDFDVQCEFPNDSTLTLIENGKIDWTAKKIK